MRINCPQCGKQYRADDSFIGRAANCKACGGSFQVPQTAIGDRSIDHNRLSGRDRVGHCANSTLDGDNDFAAGDHEIGSAPVTMRGGQSDDHHTRSSDEIDYEIFGQETQYVEITLDPGEQTIAEAGALMYMNAGIEMQTVFGDPSQQDNGLLGKAFSAGKRAMTGESLFMTTFTNMSGGQSKVVFGSP